MQRISYNIANFLYKTMKPRLGIYTFHRVYNPNAEFLLFFRNGIAFLIHNSEQEEIRRTYYVTH